MRVQIDRFEDNGWAVLLPYPEGRKSFDVPRELLPEEVSAGISSRYASSTTGTRPCASPKRIVGSWTSCSGVRNELGGAAGWRRAGGRLQDIRGRARRCSRRAAERSHARGLRDQRGPRQRQGIT